MNNLQRAYWVGGAFTLIGAFFFSLQDALVKWLSSDYALLQLLLVRSSIMVPTFALICLARWGRQGLVTRRPGAHLLRAAFNLIAFLSYYYAISRMPLVDALSIASAYPLILTLLSGLVLAEVPNARQIMAILAGFVGVLFIIQPTGNEVDWIGASAALFGCFSFAALAIHTRRLSKTESSELMLLTGAGCILILSLLSAPFTWSQPKSDRHYGRVKRRRCGAVCYLKSGTRSHCQRQAVRGLDSTISGMRLLGEKRFHG